MDATDIGMSAGMSAGSES